MDNQIEKRSYLVPTLMVIVLILGLLWMIDVIVTFTDSPVSPVTTVDNSVYLIPPVVVTRDSLEMGA